MPRKLTIEEIKQRLFELHGDTVIVDESTYVRARNKAKFIDKDYGEWWIEPKEMFSKKSSHPKRWLEKVKKTCLERYGCEHVSQNKEVQEKIKQTCLERFGVENASQSQQIRNKISNSNKISANNQETREKTRQTCLEKYGVTNVSQNPTIAKKAALHQCNSLSLTHWKTGENIVCHGSYEIKVVQHFNDNHIDFDWQIPFDMPNGRKYFIDCYLPEQDLYVEIKGYFRQDSKVKFDWFCSEHSNTELWNKPKLLSMGINVK